MASRLTTAISTLTSILRETTPRPHILRPYYLAYNNFKLPRRMASSSAAEQQKWEWLVVVPDKPGMKEKRLEVRPTHFANFTPHIESGAWKMGGAILSDLPSNPTDPTSYDFAGSTIVCVAEAREEIMEVLRKDIYAETGVWDLEKVMIWPLKCAFRKATGE